MAPAYPFPDLIFFFRNRTDRVHVTLKVKLGVVDVTLDLRTVGEGVALKLEHLGVQGQGVFKEDQVSHLTVLALVDQQVGRRAHTS
jgi:hypothetical protein